ncbi:hypothetical protein SAY87_024275 [Trapa incisa]|uniref:AT-hook motif nuclear-localized protein n=1 Tax=Trapa incisa TaxID=236973 RepID=A0AAN7GKK5_9MYRT|nr:hypothetical protein SAY87_024275 [Trapa incisa]
MEGKEEVMVGVTVKGDEAPESYRVAPRAEGLLQLDGSPADAPLLVAAPEISEVKKKRGRPRKYGPDGVALSPMPISSSIPLWQRSKEKIKRKHKLLLGSTDNPWLFVGGNFVPHVITVNPGEDVSMKVMSFSQQGSRAICVLSANGSISNVTLRSPTSCGGTLTYEGRFEILSLSGSFTPSDGAGTMSRSGGMSISLAGPDGRVLGGGLGGLLIAAGPVQVVIGSFLSVRQLEHKPKKQRASTGSVLSTSCITAKEVDRPHGGFEQNVPSAPVYNGENTAAAQDVGIPMMTANISFGEGSNGLS